MMVIRWACVLYLCFVSGFRTQRGCQVVHGQSFVTVVFLYTFCMVSFIAASRLPCPLLRIMGIESLFGVFSSLSWCLAWRSETPSSPWRITTAWVFPMGHRTWHGCFQTLTKAGGKPQDLRVFIHHGRPGQSPIEAWLAGPVGFGWSILGRYCIDLLQRDSAPS